MKGYSDGYVPSVYIGGGSPSTIKNELPKLARSLKKQLSCRNIELTGCEFTVEVNPGDIDQVFITELANEGVNRISIGVQSFDDNELKLLGRRHSSSDVYKAVELCRKVGLDNISLDLIFGLPDQTLAGWEANLAKALELAPCHMSIYSLMWEEGTAFTLARAAGKLTEASDELDREMYYLAIDKLAAAGIMQYEISNFARIGYESRHNIRYWDDDDYIGIGPAAGSHVADARWNNIADIDSYITSINSGNYACEEIVQDTQEDTITLAAVLALRRIEGIDIAKFNGQFGVSPLVYFAQAIEKNTTLGLIKSDRNQIKLTRKGLSFADTVSQDFV